MTNRVCKDCGCIDTEIAFNYHMCPLCNSENTQSMLPINKYGGYCGNCKEYVKAGQGWYTKYAGVNHHICVFKTKSRREFNSFISTLPNFNEYDPDK